jgi:hypothetical protein
MNSPTSPGQKSSGAKAARVVAVAAMTGIATSPVAFFAARRNCSRASAGIADYSFPAAGRN